MSEYGYDKGPWIISPTNMFEILGADSEVCHVYSTPNLGNAALIAAAPELLSALEGILEHGFATGDVGYYKKGISVNTDRGRAYYKAINAVAKARRLTR